ncbi:MAG: AAA family ATPase [Planctomycetaceae bacterium]|jgi:putative nucleotidyltransferase with HDIG domain|nr:AAA family ATPase [Planctomycetaceae bacterium]
MNDPPFTSIHAFSSFPTTPEGKIDWSCIENYFGENATKMSQTPQDPMWHAEGDVWTHTKMVCETLIELPGWNELQVLDRIKIFLAALLHDVGKPNCTKTENGRIISPKHAVKGSQLARQFLWQKGWAGKSDSHIKIREDIVSFVRFHSVPYQLFNHYDPLKTVAEISVHIPLRLLALLSEADLRGRIDNNIGQSQEKVAWFREFAEENYCWDQPYPFTSDYSRYAYFSGVLEHPSQTLYDSTWGEVILMSGLPASGKDMYIKEHFPHLPEISLDAIRQKMKIEWLEDQTPVINTARELAKDFLRKKQPFVWNATNLLRLFRQQIIRLCDNYNARVKIVYVETEFPTLLQRNCNRMNPVDESVYDKMLGKIEFPTRCEVPNIEYVVT